MSPLYATSIMYAVGEFLDSCVIQECGLFDDFLSWAHVDFISPFSSGWPAQIKEARIPAQTGPMTRLIGK